MKMDRRRLEAAHLRFAVLKVGLQYELGGLNVHPDNHITLADITPRFYSLFRNMYASKYAIT